MLKSGDFNFSFSGLKTAVRYLLPKLDGDFRADLCASFQEAVVDILVQKTIRAAKSAGVKLVTVSGGVSANSRLRSKMRESTFAAGLERCSSSSPHDRMSRQSATGRTSLIL